MPDALADASSQVRQVFGQAIHDQRLPVDLTALDLDGEPVPPADAIARLQGGEGRPFAVGDDWGGMWATTWFRLHAQIPHAWQGREVAALVHLGGGDMVGFSAEGLIFDADATPLQGVHHQHRSFTVAAAAEGGETVDLYLEAAANPIPKWHLADWPLLMPDYQGTPLYRLEQLELATVDRAVMALYLDARTVVQIGRRLDGRADEARAALHAALATFDIRSPSVSASPARAFLEAVLSSPSKGDHFVTAVGHAHIDSAWLWPIRETKRKCARTFANQLRLMERYPEHHFVCSQAVQYQWMKDGYPHLYEEIRERVAEGRWEAVGGMWVEPDVNIPSGESLVRQLVHGKRFFLDEFDVESHELWIPDVFGYSAALPQIAARAGVTSLVTQKMSWNDTNVFPRSTFWWEGHDGSRLLAHFPPANTYNGDFSVNELAQSQTNFKDHQRSDKSLYPFGFGDGGGGPTELMLETARRLADVDGLPCVEIGGVGAFFDRLRADDPDMATWTGELYLEAHRATLTTHGAVKLANRRAEEALRAAEMWSVAARIDRRDELDGAWKTLLLHQFHDILPGSSIHWVYDDTARDHAAVLAAADAVIGEATAVLAPPSDPPRFTAFNPSSYERTEIIELPSGRLTEVTVPGCGWTRIAPQSVTRLVDIGEGWMDNSVLRVTWDAHGLLTSVWDHRAGRQVLAAGSRGNLFQIHEDHPKAFDAWDVDRAYLEQCEDIEEIESIEIAEDGGLRGGVRFVRRFGDSRLEQVMRLSAGSRRLEFHTEVDWHERHRFLKVAFPVDVRSPRATYEIQHGHIERPTVENTSWDEARFEVCGHRWADLSDPGYGVALLNNGKYGYDIRANVMRLSLLRGPGFPDPEADEGYHRFAYALLPHAGDLRDPGRVVEEAEAFNLPLTVAAGRGRGQVVAVDQPGISVEAVKWADRRDGVVVRLCEVWGRRITTRLTLALPFESVTRTDLLERDIDVPLDTDGASVSLELRPFELSTLLFSGGRRPVR